MVSKKVEIEGWKGNKDVLLLLMVVVVGISSENAMVVVVVVDDELVGFVCSSLFSSSIDFYAVMYQYKAWHIFLFLFLFYFCFLFLCERSSFFWSKLEKGNVPINISTIISKDIERGERKRMKGMVCGLGMCYAINRFKFWDLLTSVIRLVTIYF